MAAGGGAEQEGGGHINCLTYLWNKKKYTAIGDTNDEEVAASDEDPLPMKTQA